MIAPDRRLGEVSDVRVIFPTEGRWRVRAYREKLVEVETVSRIEVVGVLGR
jgi:hypothetical protein